MTINEVGPAQFDNMKCATEEVARLRGGPCAEHGPL